MIRCGNIEHQQTFQNLQINDFKFNKSIVLHILSSIHEEYDMNAASLLKILADIKDKKKSVENL